MINVASQGKDRDKYRLKVACRLEYLGNRGLRSTTFETHLRMNR